MHEAYIDHILKEASYRAAEAEVPLTTVYIGGGTPSVLSPSLFRKLIRGLKKVYNWDSVIECTTEANPGTVSPEWLESAANEGINRISFGMQASQNHLLSTLGRIHRKDEVAASVRLAHDSGISNVSLDLIFGIPGQTESDWTDTLEYALSLGPRHISAYGLIPEEGTPLFRDLQSGLLQLPVPETERAMYDKAVHLLSSHGFNRYEISNFAMSGYECMHNIGYWTQVPYVGLGISAASMVNVRKDKQGFQYVRKTNPCTLEQYHQMIRDRDYSQMETEAISPGDARFETMMLALRMNRGISEERFYSLHGVTIESCYGKQLKKMQDFGLMQHKSASWMLTAKGMDIQNSILVELMEDVPTA